MSILSWNVCGWTQNNAKNREAIVLGLKCDIVVLQETHLKNENIVVVPGYRCDPTFFNNRKEANIRGRKGYGGVAMLFKNEMFDIFNVKLLDKTRDGVIVVRLEHKFTHYTVILIGCYLPPEQSTWGRDAVGFYAHLLNIIYNYSESDAIYICGDFNSRIGNKKDYIDVIDNLSQRNVLDSTVNNHGICLHDFLLDSCYCIVNGRISPEADNFTFLHSRGRSVVDYFLVSCENIELCKSFEVISPLQVFHKYCSNDDICTTGSISDHSVLVLNVHITANDLGFNEIREITADGASYLPSSTIDLLPPDDIFYKRFFIDTVPENFLSSESCIQLFNDLINSYENVSLDQELCDEVYGKLCDLYHKEMESTFRSKNVHPYAKKSTKKKSKPFWNTELKQLWEQAKYCEKDFYKASQENKASARQHFQEARNNFDRVYRRQERIYNRANLNDLEINVNKNPREFWKLLNQLGPRKSVNIPLEVYNDDGEVVSDLCFVLNRWKKDYENMYNIPPGVSTFNDEYYNSCLEELQILENEDDVVTELNNDIAVEEVTKAIEKSKNKKAVGLENLPNEVFKNEISTKCLSSFFKEVFKSNVIPKLWRKAVLKPIPKGPQMNTRIPLEYRGISLLSTLYKIFSSVLNQRLVRYGEVNNIFVEEQNGFRSGRSCDDHNFVLCTIIRQRKLCRKPTFVGFIDLKKAFDCVDRNMLLYKLLTIGIRGQLFKVLKNIYSLCFTCVNLNGFLTEFFPSSIGVRQGDCLSTTLFLYFINDLIEEVKSSSIGIRNDYFDLQCLMYADDLAFISETENDLQNMFNCLSNWCSKWRITVNVNKSHVIHFRNARQEKTNYRFLLNAQTIEIVDKCKYLGLVLHEYLDFKITSGILADSGGRALGAIYNKYRQNKGLGYDTYTKLYNCGVVPILDYGSSIWGFQNFEKIDSIQNRAIRLYLGVHKFTSNVAINGEFGWIPSRIRRHVNMLRFWNRLISMNNSRLTKKVFLWDKNSTVSTWCSDVFQIFDSVSMSSSFFNNSIIVTDEIKGKLFELFKSQWTTQTIESPKLRTYISFKNNYCTEAYLKKIHNRNYRSCLAQFRCGILPLAIETGRFQNIPLEYRLCIFCHDDVLEDEYHFLLSCTAYSDLRACLIEKVLACAPDYVSLNSVSKFRLFMSDEIVRYTAEFIYKAYNRRRSVLYR